MSLQDQLKATLQRKRVVADPRLRPARDALATWLPAEELLIEALPWGEEKVRRIAEWQTYLEAYEKLETLIGGVEFHAGGVES